LGFGYGNLKDNKMEKLSNHGNGNYAYIDNISEAKKVLVQEIGGTLFTIAKDVKIQVEFNPAKVKAYRLIGYENRRLQDQDFNDDTKDAGELGAGHTVTALYEIIPVGVESKVRLPNTDDLRYQEKKVPLGSYTTDELMSVKLRYKQPQGSASLLINHLIKDNNTDLFSVSNNFLFSASVAEFGLLLRNDQYKGEASFAHVLQLANKSKTADLNNYRQEFINLVQKAQGLTKAHSLTIE
jgi:Ca-activated chloride channel family protein